jgi:hypothetical protein
MAIPIGGGVTLLCVFFSARIALAFLRNDPRAFTVMALLACSWAQVFGYYSAKGRGETAGDLSDLISDLAAFLLVYLGGLLILDTSDERSGER